jgi:hypothetical protein
MSTGLNCEFVKVKGEWFYILEHSDAPKNAWVVDTARLRRIY